MLDQDRQLEGPDAQSGVLEVDNPDPLAVPEEVGEVSVALSEHSRQPRPASPAAATLIGIGGLADRQLSALANGPCQPVQAGRVGRQDDGVVAEVPSLDGQL